MIFQTDISSSDIIICTRNDQLNGWIPGLTGYHRQYCFLSSQHFHLLCTLLLIVVSPFTVTPPSAVSVALPPGGRMAVSSWLDTSYVKMQPSSKIRMVLFRSLDGDGLPWLFTSDGHAHFEHTDGLKTMTSSPTLGGSPRSWFFLAARR